MKLKFLQCCRLIACIVGYRAPYDGVQDISIPMAQENGNPYKQVKESFQHHHVPVCNDLGPQSCPLP